MNKEKAVRRYYKQEISFHAITLIKRQSTPDIQLWLHGIHSGGKSFLSPNRIDTCTISLQSAGEFQQNEIPTTYIEDLNLSHI